MSTPLRLNRAWICVSARRTVAVEATILGRIVFFCRPARDVPAAECVEGRLVEPDHGAQRAGDQVQLVLDDQVGRQERGGQRLPSRVGVAGAVEAVLRRSGPPGRRAPRLAGPGQAANLSTVAIRKHGRRR